MSAAMKPAENKREEFRKYLERTGVMDALTKVLVQLYEEPDKPENALDYICGKLMSQTDGDNVEDLKQKLEEAQKKISELESQLVPQPQDDPAPPTEDISVEEATA